MKNTINKFVVAFMLLVSFSSSATDGVNLKVENQCDLIVDIQKTEYGSELSLLSQNAEVIFRDQLDENARFSKKFNFDSLEDGEYLLVLNKKYCKSTTVITKLNDQIVIDKDDYKFAFKPCFKIEEDQVVVYMPNLNESKLSIEVFDNKGIKVGNFETREPELRKAFDFSEVDSGKYTFIIETSEDSFEQIIEIG
ncbi:hypothetical protein JM79_1822 [Gramella sp. Hel_I_59]|uniref:hypothetical protein n=1 Tax=Gramella sp. Hel_I_59 TaxID=1249978 RepID=UPI00114D5C75|nr:hypothetical protein [Gramella sp. Hel_I_59]TQI70897.1 hypothetical protein JM79_1822 [Gramella sp. Hel_I_59]